MVEITAPLWLQCMHDYIANAIILSYVLTLTSSHCRDVHTHILINL